ncbi:Ig-like domain-containing protein [Luteimonas sp. SDU82]|uniref:Ig-like domain-containing protein n=1 Tax=Luteimonas sp. SDU82 TaxID=3422592 RepID=UPI003EC114FE
MSTEIVQKAAGNVTSINTDDITLYHASIVKLKIGPELVERFERAGDHLLLVLKDGRTITIRNFFVVDEDGERSDLVLEDADEVLWWGQYTSPWSEFHFAEIQEDHALLLPPPVAGGLPGWAIAALGLIGAGALYKALDDDDDKSNNPPEAQNHAHTLAEDTSVTGRVAGTDPDGDSLTYTVTTQPAHGTVTINPQTGEYTYTPAPDYNGPDTFVVTIDDGNGGTTTSTITIDVTPVNDPPSAQNYGHETPEDTPVSGRVVGEDVDGDSLTYVVTTPPANGTVVIDPDTGEYTYTPNEDYNGPDEFVVTIDDGNGGTTTSTIVIEVTPVNDTPVPADPNEGLDPQDPGYIPGQDFDPETGDYSHTTPEDTPVSGRVTGTDPDGDELTYTLGQPPANGTVVIDPDTGEYTYTPNEDYNGPDEFVVIIDDGNGGTTTSTVVIEVIPVNDPPVFEDPNAGGPTPDPDAPGTIFNPPSGSDPASYTINYDENTPADTVLGRVQAGDVDGDAVTFAITGGNDNGWYAIDPVTGEISLTPAGAASLANDYESGSNSRQVTVEASDGNGGTTTIVVTLNELDLNESPVFVDPNAGGTPPEPDEPGTIFNPPSGSTPASYTISYNENTPAGTALGQVQASDDDGDTVTFAITGGNGDGWYAIDPTTGVITLTPEGAASLANDYESGDNSHPITVTASDGNGGTTTITVHLNELDLNESPVPADPNEGLDPQDPGYIPGQDFDPETGDYSHTTPEDTPVSGRVTGTDPDGDELTYTLGQPPANGTVVIDPDTGEYTYTPNEDYNGPDEFVVIIDDGNGGTTTSTVVIEVIPVNDPPVFEDPNAGGPTPDPDAPGTIFNPPSGSDPASYTINYDENTPADTVLGRVQAGDVDGDAVTFAITGGNDNGWYAIDPVTGEISLTPAGAASLANDYESGSNSRQVTVEASDGNGGTTTIVVTLNELDLNESPVFVEEDPDNPGQDVPVGPGGYAFEYDENSPAGTTLGTVAAVDQDGDTIAYSIDPDSDPNGWYAIDPATGEITLTAAGAASEANDFEAGSNSRTITVIASDGNGGATSIPVTLNERDLNDNGPVVIDATAHVSEEGLPNGVAEPGDDTDTVATGTVTINDADSVVTVTSLTLSGPSGLTSGGEPITWTGTGTASDPLIGTADGNEVLRATIDLDGNYEVTLSGPVDHPPGGGENTTTVELTVTAGDGVNPSGTGTLNVVVQDDAPVASPGSADVVLPEQDTNVMLILDISGSMGAQRTALMKQAVEDLLNTYDGLGEVSVRIVLLGIEADSVAWGDEWTNIEDAIAYVQGLSTNSGGTNYDASLVRAMDAFHSEGKIAGAKNVSYFLSDGQPNGGFDWPGIPGTQGDQGIQDNEEAFWIDFLRDNQIHSMAFGMQVPANQLNTARENMDRIAYDGINDANTDAVMVGDINELPPILRDTVVDAAQGAVVDVGGALGGNSALGADGGGLLDITVNGRTYDNEGNVTGGAANGTFDPASNTWNILTEGPGGDVNTGGRLVVNMETGEYSYTPPIIDSGTRVEDIGFTLIDGDGDTAASTLTITVHPAGTVLPDSLGGESPFSTDGDEVIAGSLGEEQHALPAMSDLLGPSTDGSLDAWLPADGANASATADSGSQATLPVASPVMQTLLDELDQQQSALV